MSLYFSLVPAPKAPPVMVLAASGGGIGVSEAVVVHGGDATTNNFKLRHV
jgi:hypothetical protein